VGPVRRVADADAERYWESRPRGHQLSAWASPQSDVVDRELLSARVAELEAGFAGAEPPLPPFWGGYRVGVGELECWQGRPDRLHDRVRYRPDAHGGWIRERLAP
jgi:pyridoxamine 5'-phosphate oxidase